MKNYKYKKKIFKTDLPTNVLHDVQENIYTNIQKQSTAKPCHLKIPNADWNQESDSYNRYCDL